MHKLARLDHAYVWHPFTQMRDWLTKEPLIIVGGDGTKLIDVKGRSYLDANSSIWTNLHGHRHPVLDRALSNQARKIAHVSALGYANEPASLLAKKLVHSANPTSAVLRPTLGKVFFSDNGSTAVEVALKLAYEYARRIGKTKSPRFLSLEGAYHGDTIGAVSLGHIDLFHGAYRGLLFKSDKVAAPYCYRCPHNKAKPERRDSREWRNCKGECVAQVAAVFESAKKEKKPYSAMVIEPLMQGAAGMIAQPEGWLKDVVGIVESHGAQWIADEVMTGFGRTGVGKKGPGLFASHKESVQPDYMALAKGLTGGYMPMAATLTTGEVFDAFLGDYAEFRTFFHGHSYTANPLGAAVALASLELLKTRSSIQARRNLEKWMAQALEQLWVLENVGDIRRVGLVAGIELVKNWRTREPFALRERAGIRVCEAMARRGVLTRPIGNVIVLMPPYCTTEAQLKKMVSALAESVEEVLGDRKRLRTAQMISVGGEEKSAKVNVSADFFRSR